MRRHGSGDLYNTHSTVQDKFTSSLMDLGDCGGRTSRAVLCERDCGVCRDGDNAEMKPHLPFLNSKVNLAGNQ